MITIPLFPLLVGAVQLLATYRKILRMSLYPEGCLVADTDQPAPYSVVTTPVENVIDTTSAGDSFNVVSSRRTCLVATSNKRV